jgi:glucose-1-phosphate thymidylyltransferase
MDGAELVNSSVDGAVVFPDATVVDCDVRASIIDQKTHVEKLDLSGAMIGAHTQITNGE